MSARLLASNAGGAVDTTTTLSTAKASAEPNEPVTFSAHVLAAVGGNPLDGTVTFDFGDGSGPVDATCEPPPLGSYCDAQISHAFTTPGTYSVVAQFNGSANGNPSTSNTVSQGIVACTVNPVVTTNADSGAGSLRQAMIDSCGHTGTNAIAFDMGSVVSPITLTSGELTATRSGVIVDGPGARALTIRRDTSGSEFRIFHALQARNLEIRGVTITDGVASGSDLAAWGGGIFAESASVTLRAVAVKDNTAGTGGGVAVGAFVSQALPATLATYDTTISGNTATGSGGGIALLGFDFPGGQASGDLYNTTISGNEAADTGGGLLTNNRALSVRITNVTIANNRVLAAAPSGGGLFSSGTAPFLPWLRSVIVFGNFNGASPSTAADDVAGSLSSASTNNLIGVDAKLGALADNGGPTDTHALRTGSPAIDAGNNQYAQDLSFDQRGTGFDRRRDGPDADTFGAVDIGAYEADPAIEDISDQATGEDTPITVPFRIGDASTGTFIDLFATSSNDTLVPNDAAHIGIIGGGQTRDLQITPVASLSGTTTLTVTYRKSVGGVTFDATDSFLLTVTSVNDAPTLDAIAPLALNEDAPLQTVNLAGISAGAANESQVLSLTATSDNTALIPHPGVGYTNPDATGTLTFTPAANAHGTATITVTALDDGGTLDGGVDVTVRTLAVTVSPVADTPQASVATTPEDTQTSSGLVITRNTADGAEVAFLKVTGITHGRLYHNDGTSEIVNGDWLWLDDAASGLRFTPASDFFGTASFDVQASLTADDGGLGGGIATATIDVTPVAGTPSVTPASTTAQVQTASGLVVSRNAADGGEVSHFRISAITNGRLFLTDGITEIHSGDFITSLQGGEGLKFTPADGFTGVASFQVHGATDELGGGLSDGAATATIAVSQRPSVTTAVSANPNPSDQTQPIAVVYSVVSGDGSVAATGNVTVSISGGTESCTGTVAEGQCTLTPTTAGLRDIVAAYDGDTLTAGSTSAPLAHTVNSCLIDPIVTNTIDDGVTPNSLRVAVNGVCTGNTITFNIPGDGRKTITLNGNQIVLSKDMTIAGSSDGIVIDGHGASRIFEVALKAVTLDRLSLVNGRGAYGGAILNNGGTLTIANSTLSGNTADISGGAIHSTIPGNSVTVRQSTISGNTALSAGPAAGLGGGISINVGLLTVTHATISGNSASSGAGGVAHEGATIANSIVAGNTAPVAPNASDGITEVGSNLLSGDPLLGPLQNNGGATDTRLPLAGSPALDAGDNAVASSAGLTIDQRGFARVLDAADADTDQAVDIGAVEADPIVEILSNVVMDEDTVAEIAFNIGDAGTAFDSIVATSDTPGVVPPEGLEVFGGGSALTLRITPVPSVSGIATVALTAKKTVGGVEQSSATSFTVTVNAEDDPPTLAAIGNPASIPEDAPQQTVSFSGVSAGPGESQPLTVTAASSNPALIPDPAVTYASPGATGSLSYTPATNKSGTAIVTVTVSDGLFVAVQTFTVTVAGVADTPTVTNGRSEEDGASEVLKITKSPLDGAEVTHYKITNITGGTLVRQTSGLPAVNNGDFLTISQGNFLRFIPSPNSIATGHFTVQASIGATDAGLGGGLVTADILVDPVPDEPVVTPATTAEDTQTTSGLVITRSAVDGPEITHFKILQVFEGTLFQHDGTTPIPAGGVITAAQGAAGLRYTPRANFSGSGVIFVMGALDASGAVNGSPGFTPVIITVTPVNDLPTIAPIGNQQLPANTSLSVPVTIGDVETAALLLYVSATSSNQTVMPNGGLVVSGSGDGVTRTLAMTPAANQAGSATITVTVTDFVGVTTTSFGVQVVSSLPTLTIGPAMVVEGNGGTVNLTFPVTRTGPSAGDVSANYVTHQQTAIAGVDYAAGAGTVTIPAGMTTASITIPVTGDTAAEIDETLVVTLSGPSGAILGVSQAIGTIVNDDGTPPIAAARVAWSRLVGASSVAGTLTKTGPVGWNAGAGSAPAIAAGDASVEFSVAATDQSAALGLSTGDTNAGLGDLDYAIAPTLGQVYVMERGVTQGGGTFGAYAAGDRFALVVSGGVVAYQRNGVTFHTSTVAPTYPLLVDTALFTTGATLNDVVLAGALTTTPRRQGDFDGDGRTDLAIYRPIGGTWYTLLSGPGYSEYTAMGNGSPVALPVPGDYDGDHVADIAVYRSDVHIWDILKSSTYFTTVLSRPWGAPGDVPVPADYDGDGVTDMAVWRPSTGAWWILTSGSGFTTHFLVTWGTIGDVPVPGDYDGDGLTDPAVYRPSSGQWFLLPSSTGYSYGSFILKAWGVSTDITVPGDFDGDGKSDLTVYRPSTGVWWTLLSSTNFTTFRMTGWGTVGDVPVMGDYDGDGQADLVVFRPSTGVWWVLRSAENHTTFMQFAWGFGAQYPALRRQ